MARYSRDVFVNYLRKRFPIPLVEQYIKEAEHQDGHDYWQQFERLEQAAVDYLMYVKFEEVV